MKENEHTLQEIPDLGSDSSVSQSTVLASVTQVSKFIINSSETEKRFFSFLSFFLFFFLFFPFFFFVCLSGVCVCVCFGAIVAVVIMSHKELLESTESEIHQALT